MNAERTTTLVIVMLCALTQMGVSLAPVMKDTRVMASIVTVSMHVLVSICILFKNSNKD